MNMDRLLFTEERRNASERRILYVQYTNPAAYPPLEHSSRILAREGWNVLFLGTAVLGAERLEFSTQDQIEVRQMPFYSPGWRQKLHYLQFSLWVIFWTLCRRPRWIYASDPLVAPIALLLSYVSGRRVLYHEHDSPNVEQRAGSQEHGADRQSPRMGNSVQKSEISTFMRFV